MTTWKMRQRLNGTAAMSFPLARMPARGSFLGWVQEFWEPFPHPLQQTTCLLGSSTELLSLISLQNCRSRWTGSSTQTHSVTTSGWSAVDTWVMAFSLFTTARLFQTSRDRYHPQFPSSPPFRALDG